MAHYLRKLSVESVGNKVLRRKWVPIHSSRCSICNYTVKSMKCSNFMSPAVFINNQRSKNTLSSVRSTSLQTIKSIESYLKQKEIKFNHGHTTIIAQCPFCETAGRTGSLTLFVNKTTGSHVCNSCGTSGTWSELKHWLSEKRHNQQQQQNKMDTQSLKEESNEKVEALWGKTKPFGECKESLRKYISKKVEIQPLTEDTLKFYNVHTILHKFSAPDGSQRQQLCLAFPWYNYEKEKICGVKLHKVKMREEDSHLALDPRHGFPSMYGWHTIKTEVREVVITADEFDAMAVYQATSFPSLSLPLGLSSLPPEVLPHLEQFEKIILWFGNDVRSRQAVNKFARKLNIQRCHFVRMESNGPANALDALRKGHDLGKILADAHAASHKQIVTFQQLRDEVYNELYNCDQVAGIKWTRFAKLSEILKGHRRGELTVFTGPTGAGKTTLLSELSVDLCMQGVNTLWGSFEIRNVRLAKTMMNQFSGVNLETNLEQYGYWAEKFEMLPMYFMSFYGAQNLQDVLDTMSHAAYVYDIEHVIVDNLQFMISNSYSPDRFYAQNLAIAEFRKFATAKNVHVTLVIHPRKESDDAELQTASIFGSAKASQEADNVVILQDKKGKLGKYLQITKNRFDGTLGKVYLDFNSESLTMSPSFMKEQLMSTTTKEGKLIRSHRPPKISSSSSAKKPTTTKGKQSGEEHQPTKTSINNKNKMESKEKERKKGNETRKMETDPLNNNSSNTTDRRPNKGTALSSKGNRFNSLYSSEKPVLTGKKIAVKHLDVDKDLYLQ